MSESWGITQRQSLAAHHSAAMAGGPARSSMICKDFLKPMDCSELVVGDRYEVVSMTHLRTAEAVKSESLGQVRPGTMVQLDRLGVKCSIEVTSLIDGRVGWMNYMTKNKEAVIQAVADVDFAVGGQHEVVWPCVVLDMERNCVVAALQKGDRVVIRRMSLDKTQALVAALVGDGKWLGQAKEPFGWINLLTPDGGEFTLGKIGRKDETRASVTKFLRAATRGDADACRRLLHKPLGVKKLLKISKDVDINDCDGRGRNALSLASLKARPQIVELLLRESGIDVAACDDYQRQALHHVQRGTSLCPNVDLRVKIVAQLLAHQASVEVADHHGSTPLMFAAANGKLELVRQLVEARAQVNRKDSEGFTALSYTRYAGHRAVDEYLCNCGAIEGPQEEGSTSLNTAKEGVSVQMVECAGNAANSAVVKVSDSLHLPECSERQPSIRKIDGSLCLEKCPEGGGLSASKDSCDTMDLHVAECSDDPGQSLAMKKASGADLSAPLEAEASSAVQEDGSLHLADSPQEESSAAKNQDCGLHLARPELTDYGKYSSAEKQDCCLEMKLPELPAVFENSAVDACLAIDNVVDGSCDGRSSQSGDAVQTPSTSSRPMKPRSKRRASAKAQLQSVEVAEVQHDQSPDDSLLVASGAVDCLETPGTAHNDAEHREYAKVKARPKTKVRAKGSSRARTKSLPTVAMTQAEVLGDAHMDSEEVK